MPQDITRLFRDANIKTVKPILIESNEYSYTVKEETPDNWNFHAFYAFKKLQQERAQKGLAVKTFATIGSGNGVDAIGAYHIFPGLETALMVDINRQVLGLCKNNFARNTDADSKGVHYDAIEGSLCQRLVDMQIKADLIYANIPNVPEEPGRIFIGRNSSGFLDRPLYGSVPEEFERHFMVSQYALLKSAKKALAKNGTLVVNFGGRAPYKLLPKMFKENGYRFSEVCCGFKKQTETEVMLLGYGKGEQEYGVEFDFYRYEAAMQLLQEKKINNPTDEIRGDKLKEILEPFKVSSAQSLELYRKGEKIGHTVHLLAGDI